MREENKKNKRAENTIKIRSRSMSGARKKQAACKPAEKPDIPP